MGGSGSSTSSCSRRSHNRWCGDLLVVLADRRLFAPHQASGLALPPRGSSVHRHPWQRAPRLARLVERGPTVCNKNKYTRRAAIRNVVGAISLREQRQGKGPSRYSPEQGL